MIRLAKTVDDWLPWIYITIITISVVLLTVMFIYINHQNNKIDTLSQQNKQRINDVERTRKATLTQLHESDRRSCVAINNLNHAIVSSLRTQQRTLPTIMYYTQHPDELATQQTLINQELIIFQPRTCK